ncbi:hypothetical protein BTA51_26590 [Hahella sp. CCB-MM4]|uniref:hypothetical protein n=1 Tax=Hahella sp. (strain CCB-MM4) TaxID=1926491 RepID=UPI000B9ADAB1|nr:hypothetical protein [Hahella sp. CCB-MM4]OZG70292.1 hypothetical protein BTA51_26590 [Hahella sp. CCB-MM4]
MAFIALHRPIASDSKLERLHLFPGRHLGEEEFDRRQAYADARLEPLLGTHSTGIIYGLTLETRASGSLADSESFIVTPGLAVTAKGQTLSTARPLRANWQAMVDDYLTRTATTDATGVYYLILRQSQHTIDSPTVEPCQRAEFDPTRDSRLVTVTTVEFKRIAVASSLVTTTPAAQLQNWIASERVDGTFLQGFQQSVPLAMVAVSTTDDVHTIEWVSVAAGRYEAVPYAGYHTLMNQVHAAFRDIMRAFSLPANSDPLDTFLDANLKLDFLPAAGQLPLKWLQQPDSVTPNIPWFPSHLSIDMVPVPTDTVRDLVARHLPRRVIDLRQPAGDRIRLLLAIDESNFRPDLLNIPPIDAKLASDIYRFYMRAYNAWRRWRIQFDYLYYVLPSGEAPLPAPNTEVEHAVLDPEQFKQMDLPKPALPPLTPTDLFNNVRSRALEELLGPGDTIAPYPYSLSNPEAPEFYTGWLVNVDGTLVPPPIPTPEQDGLVIQYAVALVDLEEIENQIRAIRTRLEKTRDLVLLERQQLDTQTVSLASLAGGVAGDGNGLQVARWLPYASLNTNMVPQEVIYQASGGTASAAPTTTEGGTSGGTESGTGEATSGTLSLNANALLLEANFADSYSALSYSSTQPSASYSIYDSGSSKANYSQKIFSQNLLSSALNTSAKTSKSFLSFKPQTYSAFELGINKKRLDLLANLSKSPISKPAYQPKEFRFGVLDHISPEVNEYQKAYYGMQDLLATLADLFDPTDANALRAKLKSLISGSGLVDPAMLESNITTEANRILNEEPLPDPKPSFDKVRGLVASQYRYDALFKAGKILTQWIAICEARYNNIERKLQGKLREHTRKLAQIDKLSGLIRVARETLENLDRVFDEQVGDFGVAQRLLEEDWRSVYDINQERSRILTTAVQGLYYVRERSTPVTKTLVDPLEMRHKNPDDVVPGCDWHTDVELPDELDTFFDAVVELPMDDWAVLKPLQPKLPPFHRFEFINQVRTARFKSRPKRMFSYSQTETLHARLLTVQQQTQTIMNQWSNRALPDVYKSASSTQRTAAKVMSLEDLLSHGRGQLRQQAQLLHDRLEQCTYCLLEKLALLPGSLRLQWGQLAEDDRIKVDQVAYWPGLETAEKDDFKATRTLSELIAWLFKQLSDDADANSKTALRNLVRAVLIYASLGDPQEIVRGKVFLPPKRANPGERFRVKLNRRLVQGAQLKLLDERQQVAAELTVEDDDNDSTEVRIVNMVIPNIAITSRFAVVGKGRSGK